MQIEGLEERPRPPVRILVADDDEQLRALLAYDLRAWGSEVLEAANGREALERLMRPSSAPDGAIDLVLVDHRMPTLSGLELLSAMRRGGLRTPLILMTGHQRSDLQDQAEGLGAHAVLQKPFDLDTLHQVIREVL